MVSACLAIAGFGEVGSEKGEMDAGGRLERGSDGLFRALPLDDDEE